MTAGAAWVGVSVCACVCACCCCGMAGDSILRHQDLRVLLTRQRNITAAAAAVT
jgi:hypothetical protein